VLRKLGVERIAVRMSPGVGLTSDGFIDAACLMKTVTLPSGERPFYTVPFRASMAAL
jgi:hypothetical protein